MTVSNRRGWRSVSPSAHLLAVEFGVGEGDVGVADPDEDQRPAAGDVGEGGLHRPGISGRVEHHVVAVAAGPPVDLGQRASPARIVSRKPSRSARKASRRSEMSISVTSPPASRAKNPVPTPIGPAPTTSTRSPFAERRTADGMGADRLELDHRRVAEAEVAGRVEVLLGHEDALAHAAVDVNAKDLQRRAAIGLALAAGNAVAAGEIGVDDHRRARRRSGLSAPPATTPDNSWPMTRGYSRKGWVPSRMWKSVPQMPTALTSTATRPGRRLGQRQFDPLKSARFGDRRPLASHLLFSFDASAS